jgi:TPR repeat protein
LYDAAVKLFRGIENGLEPDETAAYRVLAQAQLEAALGGMPEAWLDYGRCLWNGWGVPQNRDEALIAYKKAAALGSGEAAMVTAYNLYWHFERYDEAHRYVQQALKTDPYGETHYIAGLMAYDGRGRPKDLKESLRLHQEAARRGNADAMFELSVFAFNGIGGPEQAVYFLRKAAELGQLRAMHNMGALHATGQSSGIAKNAEEAVKWYSRAADKGHPRAAANLGVMAIRGEGMPRDEKAAKAFFARAEELGFDVDQHLRQLGVARP